LRILAEAAISTAMPADSHLLTTPVEGFLSALEGTVPEWSMVYGRGHHDPGLDDRLFELNRARDAQRRGKPPLKWRVTFLWSGSLSPYDRVRGGFPVAVGPDFIRTTWGVVRFKPEELPSNLTATAAAPLRNRVMDWMKTGQSIDIRVALTGRLTPEESLVYDFSHEEEGQGLIMPVVRVEQVDYLLIEP
jgi:hypothetical protein